MPKRAKPPDSFPSVYREALAYHEAGHAVMACLLKLPIMRIVIGPNCNDQEDPNLDGKVYLDLSQIVEVPGYITALLAVASEPAEKLAPSYAQFATLHKVHQHLKPFRNGLRNDLIQGYKCVAMVYQRQGFAESTALQHFKRTYRDLAGVMIPVKAKAVHAIAGCLQDRLELDGQEAAELVKHTGPLEEEEGARRLRAALSDLLSEHPSPFSAARSFHRPLALPDRTPGCWK